MKTKSIIVLSVCAIIMLSFTFASVTKASAPKVKTPTIHNHASDQGGFSLEDKMI